ncbi:MAG: DUF423 domain-containing protein [Deltaproteobacteria bacterium]|nr:DUF423 domain-containing protein [Deltaproteobacteria bacterium]
MLKKWLTPAAVSGALAVGLGALGAHQLKSGASLEQWEWFQTAQRYHWMHTLAIWAAALTGTLLPTAERLANWAARLFAGGLVLFSGSLYVMAFTGWSGLAPLNPLGGACFIAGWFTLAGVGWHARR